MLLVVSDLHLRDDAAETLSPRLTEGFVRRTVVPLARDAGAREVTVAFLGDVVDVNRSAYWVDGRARAAAGRDCVPWSNWRRAVRAAGGHAGDGPGADERELEGHVLRVLDGIARANAGTLEVLAACRAGDAAIWGEDPPAVRFVFVPGNHDRLAQLTPATRAALARMLGVEHDPARPFPWLATFEPYGAALLHGHVFDPANFGGGARAIADYASSPWYDVPALGDVITVRFGVGMVHRFLTDPRTRDRAELAPSLAQADLVRPQRDVPRWLTAWGAVQDRAVERALDDFVRETWLDILRDDFVRWWLGRAWWKRLLLRFGLGRPRDVEGAAAFLAEHADDARTDHAYAAAMAGAVAGGAFAAWQRATADPAIRGARYLCSGHTHLPLVLPLAGRVGRRLDDVFAERVYFNTGTWLSTIQAGALSGFVRRSQRAHAVFFRPDEDLARNGGQRSYWEFWQGTLRRGPAR